MNDIHFTIMTEPLNIQGKVRETVKLVSGRHKKYGGHSAVTKGLIEGLEKTGFRDFNYRPKECDIYDVVHVLSGVNTLRYAMDLKRKGLIRKLSIGPNLVVSSCDFNGIIARKEVDLCITPSNWVSNCYIRREPSLKDRIVAWPVGINTDVFSPQRLLKEKRTGNVLVYYKSETEHYSELVTDYLIKRGYKTYIIKYGSYGIEQYRRLLDEVEFMVSLSREESQGIYLAEAWSMDVPTICSDRGYFRCPEIEYDVDISACPYLENENGCRFRNLAELATIIDNWGMLKNEMKPREWCINNMSDEVCSKRFIEILNSKL